MASSVEDRTTQPTTAIATATTAIATATTYIATATTHIATASAELGVAVALPSRAAGHALGGYRDVPGGDRMPSNGGVIDNGEQWGE